MSAVLWGALVAWLGVGILPFFLVQAVVGISLLEALTLARYFEQNAVVFIERGKAPRLEFTEAPKP